MNQNVALTLLIAASAAAGALATATVKDAHIATLKKQLDKAAFKNRLLKHAADAMRVEIPSDRVRTVIQKIETDYEFEMIASRNR